MAELFIGDGPVSLMSGIIECVKGSTEARTIAEG